VTRKRGDLRIRL